MAKTLVERLDSPDLDVTIFKISGTLGFHENQVLTKFFNECSGRGIDKLVMDFSELGSLGGGCAKIIRDAAATGQVRICIAGASKTVQGFLERKGPTSLLFAPDASAAVSEIGSGAGVPESPPDKTAEITRDDNDPPQDDAVGSAPMADHAVEEPVGGIDDVIADVDSILQSAPRPARPEPEPQIRQFADRRTEAPVPAQERVSATVEQSAPTAVQERDPAPTKKPMAARAPASKEQSSVADAQSHHKTVEDIEREHTVRIKGLKRTLVQYRWLFSLNEDFSAIEDKNQLLDAFLLTTIAQVGVDAAAFLELSGDEFVALCWKGFETADPKAFSIARADVDIDRWIQSPRIFPLEQAPVSDAAKRRMDSWDLPHVAPFVVHNKFRGIVLLGRPIRQELNDESWEFLSMMIIQVAIAYENSCRLEKESERTLGLVQSLISMVESKTLSRGTTELVMDLTYAVAVKAHYPEEHIRDLMYGTVLRDIGMIKTSDLILRSPRELMQEEWEVIKKHPLEGAEMLKKMKFTEHTRDIVMYHHERYNGEGYPNGLAGSQIPLGARILSVVESYAAMLHDRPTRPGLSREEAFSTLKENWGLRYDPEVVNIFVEVIEDEIRSGERPGYRGIDLIRN